ncbi:MAG: HEAT repeat domain-containing protein, partial [Oligoflexia bacterium]
MVSRKHILIAVLALLSAREGFSQGEGRSRLDRLRSGDPKLVEQALVELRKNGNPSNEESSLLADLALGGYPNVIETLRILSPQAAIEKIVLTLEQGKPQDRVSAAGVLGSLGRHAKDAVPALIRAMSDNERSVRFNAAYALGNMGEHAKDAVPALITALSDKEKYVRDSAQKAIDLIAPEDELTAPKQFPK